MAAGDVAIKVSMNTSHAEKDLAELKAKIEKFERNIKSDEEGLGPLKEDLTAAKDAAKVTEDQITKLTARIAQMRELAEMAGIKKPVGLGDAEAKLKSLEKELKEQNAEVERLDSTYTKVYDRIAASKIQLEDMKNQAGQMEAKIDMETVVKTVGTLLNRIKSLTVSMASSVGKGILLLGKGILSTAKKLNVFSRAAKSIGPALARIGTMIKQAFVFNVVTKGLNYVREQMGTLMGKNEEFTTALGRLKGVLLTAFQPIYDYIMPALTSLVNGLTRAMAVIAQFIAALFGKTASQAQASAKALDSESKSLSGTGEAADEAAGSLAGFDEINSIQTEDKSGGGGGGGADEAGADFGYMFDEAQMPFDSWGAAFDAFLGKILNGIPQLRSAFSGFANNLNGYTKKVLDMFTFPGVKEKIVALGREIATAFNGLVANINWEQIGQALGAGLNLALLFLVNLIYTFDWLSLGSSLAAALNGLVSQIDWYALGQLLWSGYKIGLETLAGFLLGLDMPQLALAASNLIIGFFNSALETVTSIDWAAIGVQISMFLTSVDWAGIFSSIGGLATGLVVGLTELISGVDWVGIATSILDGLLAVDWTALFGSLGDLIGTTLTTILDLLFSGEIWEKMFELAGEIIDGLWEGITNALSDVGNWLKEHVFQPIIDGFKKLFGIHSTSTVMAEQGGLLMAGLLDGVQNKLQPILDFFYGDLFKGLKQALNGIIQFISGVFTGDWDKAWEGIKDIFKGVWNGIIGFLESAVNLIIKGVNWLIKQMNKISFSVPDWVPGIGGKSVGVNIPSVAEVTLPRLAQGAVIPPNREFAAILGDQKRGTNVEAPLETIKQALVEALRDSGGGRGRPIVVKVMLDKRVLATAMVNEVNDMTRSSGKPVLLV